MNVRPSSLLLACAVLLSASSPALAQPVGNKKKALELWDKAKVQYDLGHWSQAIDLWEKAYETYSAPEFLFNIGQAHRQDGNCERALFFYRRYLDAKPNARNRPEVERVMKDLQETCKTASTTPARPGSGKPGEPGVPGQTGPGKTAPAGRTTAPGGRPAAGPRPAVTGPAVKGPAGSGPDVADAGGGDGNDGDGVEEDEGDGDGEMAGGVEAAAERPSLFTVRVAAGPSFPSFGGALDVGTLTSFDLSAGHPFYVGSVVLEPGVLAAYTPVPWDGVIIRTTETGVEMIPTSGTAGLITLLANLGVSREVASRFSVRGELGLGGVFFSGLTKEGNPFLEDKDEATGVIPLFGARVALGAEYALTPNLILHAEPIVFSYSPTSPLKQDIEQITRFDILLGAGYRM